MKALLQEIFLLVYRRLATFRGDAAVSTWIHRIAVNRCVDYVRSRGAKFADASRPLDDIRVPGGGSHKPERRLVERLDLERAITMLPDGVTTSIFSIFSGHCQVNESGPE